MKKITFIFCLLLAVGFTKSASAGSYSIDMGNLSVVR